MRSFRLQKPTYVMPPGHSDTDSASPANSNLTPPTVGLAKGAVKATHEYVQKADVSSELKEAILEKAEQLENTLNNMSPLPGRNRISWYEALSPSANRQYWELMNLLDEEDITLEVEVPEDFAL